MSRNTLYMVIFLCLIQFVSSRHLMTKSRTTICMRVDKPGTGSRERWSYTEQGFRETVKKNGKWPRLKEMLFHRLSKVSSLTYCRKDPPLTHHSVSVGPQVQEEREGAEPRNGRLSGPDPFGSSSLTTLSGSSKVWETVLLRRSMTSVFSPSLPCIDRRTESRQVRPGPLLRRLKTRLDGSHGWGLLVTRSGESRKRDRRRRRSLPVFHLT